jgi:(2Fe-2S) ferredoxin
LSEGLLLLPGGLIVMPRPQKHVFVCAQARPPNHPRGSCADRGCQEVVDEFMFQFMDRNCADKVMVTACGCIGPCNLGPNVVVYPEGVLYVGVKKEDVDVIFEQHLLGDQPVERLLAPAGVW